MRARVRVRMDRSGWRQRERDYGGESERERKRESLCRNQDQAMLEGTVESLDVFFLSFPLSIQCGLASVSSDRRHRR